MTGHVIRKLYGVCSVEQVFFHILLPKSGLDWWIIRTFIKNIVGIPLLLAYGVMCALSHSSRPRLWGRAVGLALGGVALVFFFRSFNGYNYIYTYFHPPVDDFYAEHYAALSERDVSFAEKRNLVVLFLESFEATYGNPEVFSSNLMPRLSALRAANFYEDDAFQVYGTGWTIGGLVGYLCGVPLRIPSVRGNSMSNYQQFLPGALSLMDILAAHGYELRFIQGSDRSFAGHERFMLTHSLSNNDIIDLSVIAARHPDASWEGWGMGDNILYAEARSELESLAAGKEPFALFISTIDTHAPGRLDSTCSSSYGDIRDVFLCADSMAADFVDWIASQPFGPQTCVVVLNDHLSMTNDVSSVLQAHADARRNLNILINPVRPLPSVPRAVTHFDFLPTVVEAVGGQVPGGRLGLGTSLYTERPTLVESLGLDALNAGLTAYSPYYYRLLTEEHSSIAAEKRPDKSTAAER